MKLLDLDARRSEQSDATEEQTTPTSQPLVIESQKEQTFTQKEVSHLPKKLQKELLNIGGHFREKNGSIEIRFQYKGKRISGSGKTYELAKKRFLENLFNSIEKPEKQKAKRIFSQFTEEWLENYKRPTVKENTYKQYLSIYRTKLKPAFGKMRLSDITPSVVQPFFNGILQNGKTTKTGIECKKLLSLIFNAAIGENIIQHNPMDRVVVLRQNVKHGKALTYEEEAEFLSKIKGTRFEVDFIILLYTGMRRCELASAVLSPDKKTIITITGKQRLGIDDKPRRIPVTPMLAPYLERWEEAELTAPPAKISALFHKIMPDHHLHELRHTFISRCRTCGVDRETVSIWVGHTPDDITTEIYTHFTSAYMSEKAALVDYSPLLPHF